MPYQKSPFTDSAAVEAWDAWFRWRDGAGLHDISIEGTWQRVASHLASAEPPSKASFWQSSFLEALSEWRLLPDERLLASAGTGQIAWREGALHASLNATGFVKISKQEPARIDLTLLAGCAELAVRALDNAALIAAISRPNLRVGLIGLADALLLLEVDYDSEEGRSTASAMVQALSTGCSRANLSLARERGPCSADAQEALTSTARRNSPDNPLHDAEDGGLRHSSLTAITSQPRLALLANVVADAIDPLAGANQTYIFVAPAGERRVRSSGYALNMRGLNDDDDTSNTLDQIGWLPQLRMRAALQPHLDEPITYPLLVRREPDDQQLREANLQAARYDLGEPRWRNTSSPLHRPSH